MAKKIPAVGYIRMSSGKQEASPKQQRVEINKLANNISLGRDWAGVHYRSDGVDGLLVGEQQAIGLLQDYSRTYNEEFAGFTLTKFNGERIRIMDGSVYNI